MAIRGPLHKLVNIFDPKYLTDSYSALVHKGNYNKKHFNELMEIYPACIELIEEAITLSSKERREFLISFAKKHFIAEMKLKGFMIFLTRKQMNLKVL